MKTLTCRKMEKRIGTGVVLVAIMMTGLVQAETLKLSHAECVEIALENNRMRKISEFDIRIAESMLQQAKSAYWPSLSAGLTAGIMDDPLVFA